MEALNAQYNENRRNAALEYAELLSDVVPKVWAQADIQQAASDVDALTQKLREYSACLLYTSKPHQMAGWKFQCWVSCRHKSLHRSSWPT